MHTVWGSWGVIQVGQWLPYQSTQGHSVFQQECPSVPTLHGSLVMPPWVTLALVQGELATLGGVGCANVVEVTELCPERAGGGASSWAGREVWMVHREDSL